ncbi:MAG: hypothetical protein ACUVSX_01650 [Aggregatilineales bacterium]
MTDEISAAGPKINATTKSASTPKQPKHGKANTPARPRAVCSRSLKLTLTLLPVSKAEG